MDDLLGMLMGASQPGGHEQSDDPLSGLLGGLAGGSPESGGDPLSDLMGGLLGGSPQPGSQIDSSGVAASSGLGGISAALLGGAGADGGLAQLLAPVIEQLMVKMGLSSQIAETVVAFVLGKLLAGRSDGSERLGPGMTTDGLDVGNLLARMGSAEGLDEDTLRATSLPQELALKTGLHHDTAVQALHQVLAILAGEPPKPAKKKRKGTGETQAKSKPKTKAKPKGTAKTQEKDTKSKLKSKSKAQAEGTTKSKAKAKSTGKAPSRSTSLEGTESSGETS